MVWYTFLYVFEQITRAVNLRQCLLFFLHEISLHTAPTAIIISRWFSHAPSIIFFRFYSWAIFEYGSVMFSGKLTFFYWFRISCTKIKTHKIVKSGILINISKVSTFYEMFIFIQLHFSDQLLCCTYSIFLILFALTSLVIISPISHSYKFNFVDTVKTKMMINNL